MINSPLRNSVLTMSQLRTLQNSVQRYQCYRDVLWLDESSLEIGNFGQCSYCFLPAANPLLCPASAKSGALWNKWWKLLCLGVEILEMKFDNPNASLMRPSLIGTRQTKPFNKSSESRAYRVVRCLVPKRSINALLDLRLSRICHTFWNNSKDNNPEQLRYRGCQRDALFAWPTC